MENQSKLNSSKEVIAWLAERFPRCFSTGGEVRPLKIGIFQDIIDCAREEMNLSKTQLRSALRLYTSSWRYLQSIKEGTCRVDLEGNPSGELDKQHIEYASKQLEQARARIHEQREKQQAKKRQNVKRPFRSGSPQPAVNVKDAASTPRSSASHSKHRRQPAQAISRKPVTDTSALMVGQMIRVKISSNPMDATVLEITKDGVRVELNSGLAMIVRAEHLQF